MAYIVDRERPFIPTDAEPQLTVTSEAMGQAIGLTTVELAQIYRLLYAYEYMVWTGLSGDPDGAWSAHIATECVRRFRGIENGSQYLEARDGDAVAQT